MSHPRSKIGRTRREEETVAKHAEHDIYFDRSGALTERRRLGGREVIVHHDDLPERDVTTVDGIPCTTALRTVIDMAPDLGRAELRRAVQHCLDRKLFTIEEARARLCEPDMLDRPGAHLLWALIAAPGRSGISD
jgi:hypothetical protein